MRLSVERIRWGLLAGALLLVAVLVVLLSYGRYRAVKAWRQIVARSGVTITHETDGVTYSQSLRGKQIFTLHAARAVPHGEGKYTLENGVLVLYGANGQPADRIYGASMDYDENQGVAHAAGQVDMDLEPPEALTAGNRQQGAGNRQQGRSAQAIHVRTSGLTYVKKLGVAATDQEVEIEYEGLHGWARGAEFDSGQSVVHLLADVRAEGTLRGTPMNLTATKADLDRDANVIHLVAPVMRSQGRTGMANEAVLHLRKDGSIEALDASGAVTLKEGTRTVSSATLHAVMNGQSEVQNAVLNGGVGLVDTNAARPMHGASQTVRIACDAQGEPTSVVMGGAVTLAMDDQRGGGASPGRQMGAQEVTLTLVREPARVQGPGSRVQKANRSRVSAVHAVGQAWARGDAVVQASGTKAGGMKNTLVSGDDLRLTLTEDAAGKQQPDVLNGAGHTRIEQRMPDGTVETSFGDALEAKFQQSARGMEIASAVQTGNVRMRDVSAKPGEQPGEGTAERAVLDGTTDVVTLTGRPRLTRGDTAVVADTVRIMQQTGDATADGNVAVSFVGANAKPGAPVTHALAASAVMHRAAQTIELHGTDAAPARMWQEASQVQAANILLDRAKDSMQAWPAEARGVVRSVFAGQGSGIREQGVAKTGRGSGGQGSSAPGGQSASERAVRVTSARLEYSGASHEAVFTGGVLAEGQDGTVRAQRGVAFLTPKQQANANQSASGTAGQGASGSKAQGTDAAKGEPDPAASLEKIVMTGAVKLDQPGRTATGEQLLYTAATGEYVLTGTAGHTPHVVDDKQGSITGATLVFHAADSGADSTIVVAGEPASRRVHTETTMKK